MEIAKSQSLSGYTVLFVGKLASLSQADARDVVLKLGGRISGNAGPPTNLVVLGEAGWPLKADGHLPRELTAAVKRKDDGQDIHIIGEQAFLKRLGSNGPASDISRLYTTQQLARILKIPAAQISAWVRKGLVQPVQRKHRLAWFNFQEVSRMRLIARLLDKGVGLGQIAASLRRLAQWLPDAATVLQRMEAYQGRLSIRTDEGLLAAPTGQMHLDFQSTDLSGEEQHKLHVIRNLRSARPKDVPIDLLNMPGEEANGPATQAKEIEPPSAELPPADPTPKLLPRTNGRVIRFPQKNNDSPQGPEPQDLKAPTNVRRLVPLKEPANTTGPPDSAAFPDPINSADSPDAMSSVKSIGLVDLQSMTPARQDAEYWFSTATELEQRGQFSQAVEAYRKATALPDAPPEAHFNLGNAYYLLGRRGAAAHQFLMAVELDGNYIESWNNLGNTLCELGHPTEGVIAFEKALAIEPLYADAHYNAGHTYAQLGLYEKATGHLKTYLKLDPNSPVAFEVAGTLRAWQRL